MTRMPVLDTPRLVIRELTPGDLAAVRQVLDVDPAVSGAAAAQARRRWLEWTALNYEQLALLYQPPYGDRGVALKATGELAGVCGFVPCLAPFGQLPGFGPPPVAGARATPEVGLFYAVAPAHRRRGYAAEAARALVDYAFGALRLERVVATTTYDNAASLGVMRRLGMRIERNPWTDPPWLQVVGVLYSPQTNSQEKATT